MAVGNVAKGTKGFVCVDLTLRFWAKVDKRGPDECWPWAGATRGGTRPYGIIWSNGRHVPAARLAWEFKHAAPFPVGAQACHKCDNPNCVNPDHIFPGTMSDNINDSVEKRRHGVFTHPEKFSDLTSEQVQEMRARYAAGGVLQRELAADYGVAKSTVGDIIRRRRWDRTV